MSADVTEFVVAVTDACSFARPATTCINARNAGKEASVQVVENISAANAGTHTLIARKERKEKEKRVMAGTTRHLGTPNRR